ncbi:MULTISPECIES: DUF7535 family protein [Haloferax]|jgi:hypothetical protein|uniref:Uncharacterized protein n=6 Tax=Haloferax TaxID=2251 RepID=D4GRZ4_HALVD|nr:MULTISPECIES: hypothetical protein [Haloferax]ADE05097.1 uncharacterized protein HVO_0453 [Haloferax volcanii DS2]ELK52538.1 hypothetical protein D320_13669 [Haloferax sp. BAB-2207]ELY25708.1 hypothetical protein C498_16433 [Haloferax volcanii DS2]ELZ58187.1 hypothetical protein C460_10393 [Haloferax sp. ATCC BAA-646]ELZ62972.1 hypothetical protein C459_11770 [Haloferax sp. ATCC BAA-645]
MSEDDSSSLARKAYHTVTPGSHMRPDSEMDSIGWTMFLILVVLLVPFLPFIAIVYVLSKVFGYLNAQRGPSP